MKTVTLELHRNHLILKLNLHDDPKLTLTNFARQLSFSNFQFGPCSSRSNCRLSIRVLNGRSLPAKTWRSSAGQAGPDRRPLSLGGRETNKSRITSPPSRSVVSSTLARSHAKSFLFLLLFLSFLLLNISLCLDLGADAQWLQSQKKHQSIITFFFFFFFSFQSSDDGNLTESRLSLTPVSEDDASHLICRVKNSMIPGAVMEDSVKLDVHCK